MDQHYSQPELFFANSRAGTIVWVHHHRSVWQGSQVTHSPCPLKSKAPRHFVIIKHLMHVFLSKIWCVVPHHTDNYNCICELCLSNNSTSAFIVNHFVCWKYQHKIDLRVNEKDAPECWFSSNNHNSLLMVTLFFRLYLSLKKVSRMPIICVCISIMNTTTCFHQASQHCYELYIHAHL